MRKAARAVSPSSGKKDEAEEPWGKRRKETKRQSNRGCLLAFRLAVLLVRVLGRQLSFTSHLFWNTNVYHKTQRQASLGLTVVVAK